MTLKADERVPVLIAGGSLVGLSAAVFLARLGIGHLLVERRAQTSHHPRGRGNNLRTMELFRTAGVEPAIHQAAALLASNHGILQAETLTSGDDEWLIRELDPDGEHARVSPSNWCHCSQNDLEPVLVRAARDLGSDIRFGTELVWFEQDEGGVTALVRSRETGDERTVRADYLLAADGPRSPVRERLGIGHTGAGDLFHSVSITFEAKRLIEAVGDRPFFCAYLTNKQGPGVLLPVDNQELWVLHAPLKAELGETLEDFTDERCAAVIRTATGVPDLGLAITGKAQWTAAERVAERFSDGRVFLAGDSAHEMSPTGAYGSNTGIQDAHNLAWKLAAVLDGWAGPGLLDTYDQERRPVAVVTSARAAVRSAEHSHPGYNARRSFGRQPVTLAMVLGYRYSSTAVVGAPRDGLVVPPEFEVTAEPGSRAPHMWLDRSGTRLSTLDLYERVPVLLSGPGGGTWHAAGLRAARQGRPLACYQVGQGPECDLRPEDGSDWAQLHGTGSDGAVLVRPDGFVAWRAPASETGPERALADVLDRVLSRR
ncbi:MAG TPA: FAD-dependent monooxygenase [Trebonia sp.]|nr:FAD-dependent monooxygenase [Trebonia sp.]